MIAKIDNHFLMTNPVIHLKVISRPSSSFPADRIFSTPCYAMANASVFMSHVAVSGYFGSGTLPTSVSAPWRSITGWMLGSQLPHHTSFLSILAAMSTTQQRHLGAVSSGLRCCFNARSSSTELHHSGP
jgi:hypothetical protein